MSSGVKHILVIDDDVSLLQGLGRHFRKKRESWATDFVSTADEAMLCLEERKYDLVLSDVFMPLIDGGALLRFVRDEFPETIRIAYSANACLLDDDLLGAAHNFISKPIPAKALIKRLERILENPLMSKNQWLWKKLVGIDQLPRVPDFNRDKVWLQSGLDQIANDIGSAAKVMQLAGIAFADRHIQILHPEQAIHLLGRKRLHMLLGQNAPACPDAPSKQNASYVEALSEHSRFVAHAAWEYGIRKNDRHLADKCYTCGLFHDIGKLCFVCICGQTYLDLVRQSLDEKVPLYEIEREALGCSHDAVGAYLLELWGFSETIVASVKRHHDDTMTEAEALTPLTIVHAANKNAGHDPFGFKK